MPATGFSSPHFLARAILMLSASWAMNACGDVPVTRPGPIIPPLAITVEPVSLTIAPGQSAVLTAHVSGGEAIRLFVDWAIEEGNAAGTIVPIDEAMNGSSTVKFSVPAVRTGPVHVVASLRRFPQVRATITVN